MLDEDLEADYADLDYVPWYASWTTKERLHYLDQRIASLRAELAVWDEEHSY